MFFSLKKEIKNILIVDIGSSSVNYFALLLKTGGEVEISTTLRSRLPVLEDPDFRHIERYAKTAIREISEDLRKKFPIFKPDMIFVVLSSPWYSPESKTVKIERKDPFVIDEDLINKLMADEVELFRRKATKSFSDSSEEDIQVLDKEIMRSVVNGYPIKNPFGKSTLVLEFSIYLSAVKKSFIDSLLEILRHYFGHVTMKIISEPLAVFKVLSEMADADEGFLAVDVGGEVTEVYLIRKGVLENVKNFSWGGNLVVRRLASSMKIELPEALALFKANAEGSLKENLEEKITPAMDGVCSQWQKLLSESLAEMGKNSPLPQKLILIGGVAGSDVLRKCVNSVDFASFTILGKPFNVLTFLPENFEGKISLAGMDKKDPEMTAPLLLALSAKDYARQI